MRLVHVLLWIACMLFAVSIALAEVGDQSLSRQFTGTARRAQTVGELRRRRHKGRRRKAGLDPIAAGKALLALAARPDADLAAWGGWRGSLARSARRALGWPQDTQQLLLYMSYPPEHHQRKAAAGRARSLSELTSEAMSTPSLRAPPATPKSDDATTLHQDL